MEHLVRVASPLRSYTGGAAEVAARGTSVAELLADLERRYLGIRFRMIDEQSRIRPHMRLYVDAGEVRNLSEPVGAGAVLHLICALSGG